MGLPHRRAWRGLLVVAGLVAIGLLGGCAGPAGTGDPAGSGGARPAESTDAGSPGPGGSAGAGLSARPLPPASARPAPAPLPAITLRRTGGLAGVFETLSLEPDGQWVWGDTRRAPNPGVGPGRGRLTPAQRAELARLAGSPALADEASRTHDAPGVCNDGFRYALTVGSLTVVWVDCGVAIPPVAGAITAVLADATPL